MPTPELPPDAATSEVDGIGPERSKDLEAAGYETIKDLQHARIAELADILPSHVAQEVKDKVGNKPSPVTTTAEAKERAQDIPGAKAKIIRQNGSPVGKVLNKTDEHNLPGATLTIRKG